jgi:hypothetical protein
MRPSEGTNRHPLDGKPDTRELTDANGNSEFFVSLRVLTPLRAKLADKLGETTACAGTALFILNALNHDAPAMSLAGAAACWFLCPVFEKAWGETLKRNVRVAVTREQFRFRPFLRWVGFDRALQHRISLVLHDLAKQERDQHERKIEEARQRRKIVQPKRYYQDSYHLTYELLGQRNDIIEIYGRPDAQAAVARLRAIDDVLNARARRADGTPLNPGDQWVEQPGAIPETADR